MSQKTALVAGTFDTKSEELNYIVDVLSASGIKTKLSTFPPLKKHLLQRLNLKKSPRVILTEQAQFLPVTEALQSRQWQQRLKFGQLKTQLT